MFLRPNGKVIKYICYNTKVSTFTTNFKTLHIGYSVTGFKEKIWMFDEVNEKLTFYLLMHIWDYQEKTQVHVYSHIQTNNCYV